MSVPGRKSERRPPAAFGEDEPFHTQFGGEADRGDDGVPAVALVVVDTSGEHENRPAGPGPMNELPAVPLHVCADKAGQFGEGPDVVRGKAVRQDTQAGAEDEGGLGRRGGELLLQF